MKKINESEAFISWAIFHIVHATRLVATHESLNLTNEIDFKKAIEKAIEYVKEIVINKKKDIGEEYTHDKFFKEKTTNEIISDFVESKYNKL